jgi:hypothetical protein
MTTPGRAALLHTLDTSSTEKDSYGCPTAIRSSTSNTTTNTASGGVLRTVLGSGIRIALTTPMSGLKSMALRAGSRPYRFAKSSAPASAFTVVVQPDWVSTTLFRCTLADLTPWTTSCRAVTPATRLNGVRTARTGGHV